MPAPVDSQLLHSCHRVSVNDFKTASKMLVRRNVCKIMSVSRL